MTEKTGAELDFWVRHWDRCIRHHGDWKPEFWDTFDDSTPLLSEEAYMRARYDLAERQVARILEMADKPAGYFEGKSVVEIGPGPVGMLEASNARTKVAIEPLADLYRENNLLLPDLRGTVYLCKGVEESGLLSNMADVLVASNCIDHVDDLDKALSEIRRILKPGGELFLNVEVDHEATVCEPIEIREEELGELFSQYERTYHLREESGGRQWVRAVYQLR